VSRPKSDEVKDIDIDIADILGHKYPYRIDIGKGDIDPPRIRVPSVVLACRVGSFVS